MTDSVQLLFTRKPVVGSSLIRAVSWSGYSHVQVVVNGDVIGAEMLKGVVSESMKERIDCSSRAALMTVPCRDRRSLTDFIVATTGARYDYLGALGLAFHKDWDSATRFWCSEWVASALKASGSPIFKDEFIKRLTPQHIFMLPFPTEFVK
ncbi:hypothetical protein [Collimonas humicola]|uniref:hypothetical protein n=1 Tax=Collimonas humicola TaxID=2825886 RepID=UPI001B8B1669|nr:hypothetical protein [Collimonas humicola]